jgi:hypothetical protein
VLLLVTSWPNSGGLDLDQAHDLFILRFLGWKFLCSSLLSSFFTLPVWKAISLSFCFTPVLSLIYLAFHMGIGYISTVNAVYYFLWMHFKIFRIMHAFPDVLSSMCSGVASQECVT